MAEGRLRSFGEFYPYYLGEHRRPATRVLHVIGTLGFLALLLAAVICWEYRWLFAAAACAYGLAWIGHFFIEKNRPATFRYPLWSLMADFRMTFEIVTGRRRLREG